MIKKLAIIPMLLLSTLLMAAVPQTKVTPKPTPKKLIKPFTAAVGLSGTSHSVTLGGCVDTTPGVSYYFYRGTVSGGENYSLPLNTSPLSTCNYVDTTVLGSSTYYYTAKAYLASASPTLSNPSNEVTAVVPADAQPAPPTGLSVGTVAQNKVPLHWTAPIQQAGVTVDLYNVYLCATQSCTSTTRIASVKPIYTSWIDTKNCIPVPPATSRTCYYVVKAKDKLSSDGIVYTIDSNVVTATT